MHYVTWEVTSPPPLAWRLDTWQKREKKEKRAGEKVCEAEWKGKKWGCGKLNQGAEAGSGRRKKRDGVPDPTTGGRGYPISHDGEGK